MGFRCMKKDPQIENVKGNWKHDQNIEIKTCTPSQTRHFLKFHQYLFFDVIGKKTMKTKQQI
jgi:hypothetical protein